MNGEKSVNPILVGLLALFAGALVAAGVIVLRSVTNDASPGQMQVTTGALSVSQLEAVEAAINNRLRELGLTESQLQGTILSGVEAFVEEQQQAQQAAQQLQQQGQAEHLQPVRTQDDFIRGNPDAAFSLIEYADFECPFCKQFHNTALSFTEINGDVNWVHRHFPLSIHNPQAAQAAVGAECVGAALGGEAFWEYSDRYYSATHSNGLGMPGQSVEGLMVDLGMSQAEAADCLQSTARRQRVQLQTDQGLRAGVTGTPGVFIRHNPTGQSLHIRGAAPLPELQNQFESFREQLLSRESR